MIKTAPASGRATQQGPPAINYLQSISKDAPAGLVVFLVALPLCLGISLASGAPLLSGVLTGIVGGMLVSWLSSSQISVSGPAAGLTVIVLTALHTLGSFQAVLVATFIAGLIQVAMGFLQAGIIGMFFPSSVIKGMLAAIGLTLILKQIPHFVGADTDYFEDLDFFQANGENTFSAIGRALGGISPGSTLIGVVSMLIILVWDSARFKRLAAGRMVPAALLVVVISIGLNLLLKAIAPAFSVHPEHMVKLPVVTSLSGLAGAMVLPDWHALTRPATYGVALTIAIVASLESLLSVEAIDKLDPHKRHTAPNRELKAQGVGNMVSALVGGLPLTAVIVRSSANLNAGAQTHLSSFIHGLLLLLSLLLLGPVLNLIPLSALAAVLLVVGYKLTRIALYQTQWKLGWEQFLPFVVTVVAILFTDLLKGVCIGMVVGIFFILKTNLESAYFFHQEPAREPGTLHLKLSEHVSFLNKASIITTLDRFSPGSRIILDGSDSVTIDYDVLEAIENFRQTAEERGIALEIRAIPQVESLGH